MPLSCSVLTDVSALSALRPAWTKLVAASAIDGPTVSPTWLLPWWRVFGGLDGRALRVLAIDEDGRLVGLAPFLVRTHWYRPGIPFRRLELLGTGEPEEDEICSEYLGLLAVRGDEERVAEATARALTEGKLGSWDELVLTSLASTSPLPELLAQALTRSGAPAELTQTGASSYIPLPHSFSEYLAQLSASSRYLVTRALRDFEAWAQGKAELTRSRSHEELEQGKRVLISLHEERWRGDGAFASRRFSAFHEEVMPALLAEGKLELLQLLVGGVPVAAAYDIAWSSKLYFYQSGRSLEVPKAIRPGIVMHAFAIRHAIEAGYREYDFFEGRSQYKRAISLGTRPLLTLRAVRSRRCLNERLRRLSARTPKADAKSDGQSEANGGVVLIGDLNMVRCFAKSGIPSVVLSSDPEDPVFYSRHVGQRRLIAPVEEAPSATLVDLEKLGRLLIGRPALFYGDDAMLLLVARNAHRLQRFFRFVLPATQRVEALVDKVAFAQLARTRGLPVPRTVTSDEVRTARDVAAVLRFPVVLKPFCHVGFTRSSVITSLGRGPQKALVADDPSKLAAMLTRITQFSPRFVVQEFISGGEDRIESFHAYVSPKGTLLGSFTGRKIRTYPRCAGESTFIETTVEPSVERVGRDILERLEHVGIVKLDMKRDPETGRLFLLEVNPRYTLWNYLGAAAGVNLPRIAYRDQMDLPPDPAAVARPGVRWLSLGDDARAFLRDYGPSGELSLVSWLRSLRGPLVFDVFAWDDASPFVMSTLKDLRMRSRALFAGGFP